MLVAPAGPGVQFAGKGLSSCRDLRPEHRHSRPPPSSVGEVRGGFTATSLSDGRVLVAGGNAEHPSAQAVGERAELYDPNTGAWTATAGMAAQRAGHVATLLRDGTVLVAGGYQPGSNDWLATAERYRPETKARP